jgi:hypothetical protein
MPKKLRYTGENPPLELWAKYPNWRNAYEEEGDEGQDETTLMPHEIQTYIGEYTSFSAGSVCFHDGREFPAFLAVGERGVDGCQVYECEVPWRIYYSYPDKRWLPFRAEWLPEEERPPAISFDDGAIFPLEIRMAVPWRHGGATAAYQLTRDGEMHEIAA